MQDQRINQLAKGLINYSCALKKGEKVLIEAKELLNLAVKTNNPFVIRYPKDYVDNEYNKEKYPPNNNIT